MARIVRQTNIGVRVSKVPVTTSRTNQGAVFALQQEGSEPKVIDKDSHRKFVKNVFAIRGRTAEIT